MRACADLGYFVSFCSDLGGEQWRVRATIRIDHCGVGLPAVLEAGDGGGTDHDKRDSGRGYGRCARRLGRCIC
jgi:hypothetical protein